MNKGGVKNDRRRGRMCKRCKGSGRVDVPGIPSAMGAPGMKAYTKSCDRCGGTGKL